MKHFSKTTEAAREQLVAKLRDAAAAIEQAVRDFNDKVARAHGPVEAAVNQYNELVAEANEWVTAQREDAQSYFDDRSEQWQEGDAGTAYAEWLSDLETEFEDAEVPECPEMDLPTLDVADDLEAVPSEVGGG